MSHCVFGSFIMAQLFFFETFTFTQYISWVEFLISAPLKVVLCSVAEKTNARHVNEDEEEGKNFEKTSV